MMENILRKDLSGIFHTVGRESVSRFQFFQTYAKTLGLRSDLLKPAEAGASRAKMLLLPNSSLSIAQTCTKLDTIFDSVAEGFTRLKKDGGL